MKEATGFARWPFRISGEARPVRGCSGPFALTHHRRRGAVGMHAVDVDLVRADHPVDVDQALVAALRRDLVPGVSLAPSTKHFE